MRGVMLGSVAAMFALAAAGCSSSSNPSPTTPSSAMNVSIVSGAQTMTTTAYNPNPITVPVGSSVTWTNRDNITHTSVSNTSVWNSGAIAPGASFTMTFPTAGTFGYHCSIHPNMVGTVTVQ